MHLWNFFFLSLHLGVPPVSCRWTPKAESSDSIRSRKFSVREWDSDSSPDRNSWSNESIFTCKSRSCRLHHFLRSVRTNFISYHFKEFKKSFCFLKGSKALSRLFLSNLRRSKTILTGGKATKKIWQHKNKFFYYTLKTSCFSLVILEEKSFWKLRMHIIYWLTLIIKQIC